MRDRERKQKTRKERRYRVSQGKEGKKMEKAGRRCIGCWEPVSSGRMGNGAEDRMDFQALRICESIVMMVVGRVRRLRVRRWGRRGITVDAGVTTTRASGARAPQLDIDGRGAWNEAVSSGRTAFAGVGEGVGEGVGFLFVMAQQRQQQKGPSRQLSKTETIPPRRHASCKGT